MSDRSAELRDLGGWLNPASSAALAAMPEDGTLLRMYPPGGQPVAGSLRSDTLDVDSHWHFHDMHQLVYAFESAVEVETAAGRHFVPRQLAAWIPSGVVHRLSLRRIPSGSVFLPGGAVENAGSRIRTLLVSPLMREMLRESMRWPLQAEASPLRTMFFAAMAALCGEWIGVEADLFLPTCRDPRLQRALDYTAEQTGARVSEVCTRAGLSERTLRRHLRAETGLTWEACRHRQRLLRAVELLGEPREPITQIAAKCGFESPSSFAKAFRQTFGEAPSAYRTKIIGGEAPSAYRAKIIGGEAPSAYRAKIIGG